MDCQIELSGLFISHISKKLFISDSFAVLLVRVDDAFTFVACVYLRSQAKL